MLVLHQCSNKCACHQSSVDLELLCELKSIQQINYEFFIKVILYVPSKYQYLFLSIWEHHLLSAEQ